MFDYLELQAFAPADIMDLYGMSSPGCSLEEQELELELDQDQDQEQDLSAFFPELMEADWPQHQQQHQRCSQCRWKLIVYLICSFWFFFLFIHLPEQCRH